MRRHIVSMMIEVTHIVSHSVSSRCFSGIGKRYWSDEPTTINLGSFCMNVGEFSFIKMT